MHENRPKWNDRFLFLAYDLAKAGMSEARINGALGISHCAMYAWKKTRPLFALALAEGASRKINADGSQQNFFEYLHDRLPDELLELWEEIDLCQTERNGVKRMETLFARHGLRTRQHFFLHALARSLFDASAACRFVGISLKTLNSWITDDPDFATLMDEIHWHKKNFFENHLMTLVDDGDPAAVLHVNKTINSDRGYGTKMELNVSGQVNHVHAIVDLDALELPIEIRRAILSAHRKTQGQSNLLEHQEH